MELFANAVASYLRSLAPRARSRIVDASDIEAALHEHAATVAANPGVTVRTRVVGGFVPNSYGYKADCDRFEVETDAQGRTTYAASRTWAESRAYGKGSLLRTWLVTPGGALKHAA